MKSLFLAALAHSTFRSRKFSFSEHRKVFSAAEGGGDIDRQLLEEDDIREVEANTMVVGEVLERRRGGREVSEQDVSDLYLATDRIARETRAAATTPATQEPATQEPATQEPATQDTLSESEDTGRGVWKFPPLEAGLSLDIIGIARSYKMMDDDFWNSLATVKATAPDPIDGQVVTFQLLISRMGRDLSETVHQEMGERIGEIAPQIREILDYLDAHPEEKKRLQAGIFCDKMRQAVDEVAPEAEDWKLKMRKTMREQGYPDDETSILMEKSKYDDKL